MPQLPRKSTITQGFTARRTGPFLLLNARITTTRRRRFADINQPFTCLSQIAQL